MAITDSGMPTTDPHSFLSTFITTNMASPDGVWTVAVNPDWLIPKKQKTYQVAITPSYGWTETANMTDLSTTQPMISHLYMEITLFAPTRAKLWLLQTTFKDMMNNQTLTQPQDSSGMTGVSGSEYHWLRIQRSEEMKMLRMLDKKCDDDDLGCLGWRCSYTVALRWNE